MSGISKLRNVSKNSHGEILHQRVSGYVAGYTQYKDPYHTNHQFKCRTYNNEVRPFKEDAIAV